MQNSKNKDDHKGGYHVLTSYFLWIMTNVIRSEWRQSNLVKASDFMVLPKHLKGVRGNVSVSLVRPLGKSYVLCVVSVVGWGHGATSISDGIIIFSYCSPTSRGKIILFNLVGQVWGQMFFSKQGRMSWSVLCKSGNAEANFGDKLSPSLSGMNNLSYTNSQIRFLVNFKTSNATFGVQNSKICEEIINVEFVYFKEFLCKHICLKYK